MFIIIFIVLFIFTFTTSGLTSDLVPLIPYKKQSIFALAENDAFSFVETDRYYTNGAKLGYVSKEYDYSIEDNDMKWGGQVSAIYYNLPHLTRFYLGIAQEMYTPSNHSTEPIAYEYPYGGFLYLDAAIINRSNNSQERIGVKLGLVGPYSLAGDIQTFIHESKDQLAFYGWNRQIGTEFIINPYYQIIGRQYLYKSYGFSADVLGAFDFALGNADIHLGGYSMLRFGHNLDVDFGPAKINSQYNGGHVHSDEMSVYVFIGGGLRVVLRNIFIEGNSPATLTGYDINALRYEITTGLMISYMGCRIGYTLTFNTRDYKRQPYNHDFGSFTFEVAF